MTWLVVSVGATCMAGLSGGKKVGWDGGEKVGLGGGEKVGWDGSEKMGIGENKSCFRYRVEVEIRRYEK